MRAHHTYRANTRRSHSEIVLRRSDAVIDLIGRDAYARSFEQVGVVRVVPVRGEEYVPSKQSVRYARQLAAGQLQMAGVDEKERRKARVEHFHTKNWPILHDWYIDNRVGADMLRAANRIKW